MSCYEQCPRKYELRYVQKVEVEEMRGIEAFTGTMVHLSLQHLYEQSSQGRVLTSKELVEHLHRAWSETLDDSVKVVKRGMSISDYLNQARVALMAYHRRYEPFDQGTTVGVEHNVNFVVRGSVEHPMTGYIDRLTCLGDGRYEIHDYKTGHRLPSPQQLRDDRQLALYEIGVRQSFPDVKEITLVWHYLAHDKELVSSRTPEELVVLERQVGDLIERIEATESFPCRRGPLCKWCEYAELCR